MVVLSYSMRVNRSPGRLPSTTSHRLRVDVRVVVTLDELVAVVVAEVVNVVATVGVGGNRRDGVAETVRLAESVALRRLDELPENDSDSVAVPVTDGDGALLWLLL
jgi:hypothetical protein